MKIVKNTLFLNGVQEVAGSNLVAHVMMYFNAILSTPPAQTGSNFVQEAPDYA
jgi:hypothetical protein